MYASLITVTQRIHRCKVYTEIVTNDPSFRDLPYMEAEHSNFYACNARSETDWDPCFQAGIALSPRSPRTRHEPREVYKYRSSAPSSRGSEAEQSTSQRRTQATLPASSPISISQPSLRSPSHRYQPSIDNIQPTSINYYPTYVIDTINQLINTE